MPGFMRFMPGILAVPFFKRFEVCCGGTARMAGTSPAMTNFDAACGKGTG
jgi:hypothetical protein